MIDSVSRANLDRILDHTAWAFVVHPLPTARIAWLDPFADPARPGNRAELVLMKIKRWREANPR